MNTRASHVDAGAYASCQNRCGDDIERLHASISGVVQGVGFRPFVFRLASLLNLSGWVLNNAQGVELEVEGKHQSIIEFLIMLDKEKPPHSHIHTMNSKYLHPAGFETFVIRESKSGPPMAWVLPDIATCPECLHDILDPDDRRYMYPFTNCTHCGPRFSIINTLPYDRINTSMSAFTMCPACKAEYEDPTNRRFHAQPNACHDCGPQLVCMDQAGDVIAERSKALSLAVDTLRNNGILAVKGLGGFHLMTLAEDPSVVQELRKKKLRDEKPFALMYPNLEHIRRDCVVSRQESRLLCSGKAPIVLLRKRSDGHVHLGQAAAPGNPRLGVMLPYTPMHHLLMHMMDVPLIATSGNVADEPICTENKEALERLGAIADVFLMHNRSIVRHIDDSIVQVVLQREQVLRRARGYAPLPVELSEAPAEPILAVGAHLKNTVAITAGASVFVSQHIGDLKTLPSYEAFKEAASSLQDLYDTRPEIIAHDAHPDYLSSAYAADLKKTCIPVQHHFAHVYACMADNNLNGPVLGIAWDGTGLGLDGNIWGGEFLYVGKNDRRFAHMLMFPLPGGDHAVREPRRSALGTLFATYGDKLSLQKHLLDRLQFNHDEITMLCQMLSRNVNSPLTSSVGRLFDAVAALCGLHQHVTYEGQAAMALEFAQEGKYSSFAHGSSGNAEDVYSFKIDSPANNNSDTPCVVDWRPMMLEIADDLFCGEKPGYISLRFHNTLVEIVVNVACRCGIQDVVLTGGCFQNVQLLEGSVARLRQEGFTPYWHQRVPPNDGGIALGQVVGAMRQMRKLQ